MITITRIVHFSASHQCWIPEWTPSKNEDTFHADTRLHGHNYTLEVTLGGPVDPESGMIMNLQTVQNILREHVLSKVAHQHLNDLSEMKNRPPVLENVLETIREMLRNAFIEPIQLEKLRLWANSDYYVEWRKDDQP